MCREFVNLSFSRGVDSSKKVSADVWSSKKGASWKKIGSFPTARSGSGSFVATTDAMFMLGGCSAANVAVSKDIFMTSKDGINWSPVIVKMLEMDMNTGALEAAEVFPPSARALCGSTLVVVDGWKLMLLGGGLGKVYVSMNREATVWGVISKKPMFDSAEVKRYNAFATQTSDGTLYVIGGHSEVNSESWGTGTAGHSDVWWSKDGGVNWAMMTANAAPGLTDGPGFMFSGAKAWDDTMMIMGGGQWNNTASLDSIFVSGDAQNDRVAPVVTNVFCPTTTVGSYSVVFSEPVSLKANSFTLKKSGSSASVSATASQPIKHSSYIIIKPAAALSLGVSYLKVKRIRYIYILIMIKEMSVFEQYIGW